MEILFSIDEKLARLMDSIFENDTQKVQKKIDDKLERPNLLFGRKDVWKLHFVR